MRERRSYPANAAWSLTLAAVAWGADIAGVSAQTDPADPGPQANYAFATQLGSGMYKSQAGTVQVYRFGFGIGLRSQEGRRWNLALRVPATFGFYDFNPASVFEANLPDGLATLAVSPELRLGIRVRERWNVTPFGSIGAGRDFSAGRMNYIAATGARSRLALDWGSVTFLFGNRFLYAAYTTPELNFGDDFGAFESGVDARHPLGVSVSGHRVDGGLFFANYLYFVSPNLVHFVGEALSVRRQWEVGATFGTTTPWRLIGVAVPRIGIGYRFGTGPSILRVVFGGPFN